MQIKTAQKLFKEGLIKENEQRVILSWHHSRLFSLHWEVKTILYLGVMLLATGAGLLIYQNLEYIGPNAILAAVGLASAACFTYCYTKRLPFSTAYAPSPGIVFDYMLLLGCLLFLTFEGYLQYRYEVFGSRYGLAVILPVLLFFYLAYRFDHKGVLSLALTGLAGWMGITVTPTDLLRGENEFMDNLTLIWTGLGFGIATSAAAFLLSEKDIKKHFTFTYLNFAANVLFFASLAGLFVSELYLLFALFVFLFSAAFIFYAKREKSFYFLLIAVVYGYIAFSYLICRGLLSTGDTEAVIYLLFFYFIGSCIGLIYFFINYKKVLDI